MKIIVNRNVVPPGGAFVYRHPETGREFRHHTMEFLLEQIKAFHRANGYPIGANFDAMIEDEVCKNHGDGVCREEHIEPPKPISPFQMMVQFAKAMATWISEGLPIVSKEVFVKRKLLCQACPHWNGEGVNFYLGRCGRCGCSGLKQHLKTEGCPDNPPRWNREI